MWKKFKITVLWELRAKKAHVNWRSQRVFMRGMALEY